MDGTSAAPVPTLSVEPEVVPSPSVPLVIEATPVSAPGSVISRLASPAQAPTTVSSPVATTPTIPSLPPKPEVDPDQKIVRRRRTRSPPTGPRHYAPTPPNATPPPAMQPNGPNLPPKPEWTRRSTAPQPAKTASPAPTAAPDAAAGGPVIPTYQPKPSVTAEIEAEIARVHAHRMHLETEYIQTAAAARRALHELEISTLDLKLAEARRGIADRQLEKAQIGMLGMDYIA
ncbi:hypothetical protein GY45DRAFT_396009 [Cubamyces sp. BRFM 1775]|nr:hypothetical protein GY45DRAFT_396009 [Cubamyces sp. BRFM 1775]